MTKLDTTLEATKEVVDSVSARYGDRAAAATEAALNAMTIFNMLLTAAARTLDVPNMKRIAELADCNIATNLALALHDMPHEKVMEIASLIRTSGTRLVNSQLEFITQS